MSWLTERRLLAAAIVAWMTIATAHLVLGAPLGHDEAAFAISARGDAPPGAWLYRSEGTVVISKIGVALGSSDWEVRLASAILGLGLVLAVYAVGRAAFDARTGAWAAAVVCGAHPIVMRSAELLSDLPSAACLVAGVALLVTELDRNGGPRWRIVAVGPALAAAFHIRYGSMPVIGIATAAATILWWRAMLARPLPVLATLVAFVLLGPLPHILHSITVTGHAFGILKVSAGMPRQIYVGEGLLSYLSHPFALYGALPPFLMIAGLVALLRRKPEELRRKAPWFLAIIGVGQIVVLGIQSHAQPRYVYVATSLLIVLGVAALRPLARPAIALGLVTLAWLGSLIATLVLDHNLATTRAPILAAATTIRADAGPQPCVFVAGAVPQLQWYAHCDGVLEKALDGPLPPDHLRYVISTTSFPVDIAHVTTQQHLTATELPTGDPRVHVWRLR